MSTNRQVATSDFILAAVLLLHDFRLLATVPDPAEPERRRRFVLSGDPSTFAKLANQLLLDDVAVPARSFVAAQRRLKQLLYEEHGPAKHRKLPTGPGH